MALNTYIANLSSPLDSIKWDYFALHCFSGDRAMGELFCMHASSMVIQEIVLCPKTPILMVATLDVMSVVLGTTYDAGSMYMAAGMDGSPGPVSVKTKLSQSLPSMARYTLSLLVANWC
ncbi:hypothetical protein SELMODRAFT_427220 [Selaginella moellendorffii]|uniref:Uncharacterized protein n=1 Tax=Selaginella moellendorffii TaxID=88036 RepID=D8SYX3_SELML|nr:hypothetical protein SELMODRAFT_427220 [Selaginella moellendorffii]